MEIVVLCHYVASSYVGFVELDQICPPIVRLGNQAAFDEISIEGYL
jgi:hypothetical protein